VDTNFTGVSDIFEVVNLEVDLENGIGLIEIVQVEMVEGGESLFSFHIVLYLGLDTPY
jgi:hypothetical protein